jgi:hypothetical protein
MKDINKVLVIISIIIITTGSCKKQHNDIKIPDIKIENNTSQMEYKSEITQINKTINFKVAVNPSSKYSFQISDIRGEVIYIKGLTAYNTIEEISLDISEIKSGAYDLIFINVYGKEIKKPLIIK